MLNEQASRDAQPLLTDPRISATKATPDEERTVFPEWLSVRLRAFRAAVMPDATMSEVVIRCCAIGAGAIDGMNFADRMTAAAAKPVPAAATESDPWYVRMYSELRAAAVAAGGSVEVDGADVLRLAAKSTSGQTRRAVGYVIGYRARDFGTVTTPAGELTIAPIGRPAGCSLHRYRLTAVGG